MSMEGYLLKKSDGFLKKKWNRRFFAIRDYKLLYFNTQPTKVDKTKSKRTLDLVGSTGRLASIQDHIFELTNGATTWYIRAENVIDFEKWTHWLMTSGCLFPGIKRANAQPTFNSDDDLPSMVHAPPSVDDIDESTDQSDDNEYSVSVMMTSEVDTDDSPRTHDEVPSLDLTEALRRNGSSDTSDFSDDSDTPEPPPPVVETFQVGNNNHDRKESIDSVVSDIPPMNAEAFSKVLTTDITNDDALETPTSIISQPPSAKGATKPTPPTKLISKKAAKSGVDGSSKPTKKRKPAAGGRVSAPSSGRMQRSASSVNIVPSQRKAGLSRKGSMPHMNATKGHRRGLSSSNVAKTSKDDSNAKMNGNSSSNNTTASSTKGHRRSVSSSGVVQDAYKSKSSSSSSSSTTTKPAKSETKAADQKRKKIERVKELHRAIKEKDVDKVVRIIEPRVSIVRVKGAGGRNAVCLAVATGKLSIVVAVIGLIENTAYSDLINDQDTLGNTPLLIASANGDYAIIMRLLKAGANPNISNVAGKTPLTIAIENKHRLMMKGLLLGGAELEDGVPADIISYANEKRDTNVAASVRKARVAAANTQQQQHDTTTTKKDEQQQQQQQPSPPQQQKQKQQRAHHHNEDDKKKDDLLLFKVEEEEMKEVDPVDIENQRLRQTNNGFMYYCRDSMHSYDHNTDEDYGILPEERGHEFNIEIQELMHNTMKMQHRDKQYNESLKKLSSMINSFISMAKSYAKIIISEKSLPPSMRSMKCMTLGGQTTYIVRGIMLQLVEDSKDPSGNYAYGFDKPDDSSAHKAAAHDFNGSILYGSFMEMMHLENTKVPSVPLNAIVNYLGHRLIARPLLPLDELVYGVDYQTNKVSVGDLRDVMESAAKYLHIAPHNVFGREIHAGASIQVWQDRKGRRYMMYMANCMPAEVPTVTAHLKNADDNNNNVNPNRLLRPELLQRLKRKGMDPVSPDANFPVTETEIDCTQQNDRAVVATKFLIDDVCVELASFVDSTASKKSSSDSSKSHKDIFTSPLNIVRQVHMRGINIRHLGYVRSLIKRNQKAREICLIELIARTSKHILNAWLRELVRNNNGMITTFYQCKHLIITFLNLFTGYNFESSEFWREQICAELLKKFGDVSLSNDERNDLYEHVCARRLLWLIIERLTSMIGVQFSSECLSRASSCNGQSFHFIDDDVVDVDAMVTCGPLQFVTNGLLYLEQARRSIMNNHSSSNHRFYNIAMKNFVAALYFDRRHFRSRQMLNLVPILEKEEKGEVETVDKILLNHIDKASKSSTWKLQQQKFWARELCSVWLTRLSRGQFQNTAGASSHMRLEVARQAIQPEEIKVIDDLIASQHDVVSSLLNLPRLTSIQGVQAQTTAVINKLNELGMSDLLISSASRETILMFTAGGYIDVKNEYDMQQHEDINDMDPEMIQERQGLLNEISRSMSTLVTYLLNSKASIDTKSKNGQTALFYASRAGKIDIIHKLLGRKANPDIQNSDEETPLFQAARAGHNHVVRILVKASRAHSSSNFNVAIDENIIRMSLKSRNVDVIYGLLSASTVIKHKLKRDDVHACFILACEEAHMPLLNCLLEDKRLLKLNVDTRDNEGHVGLTRAIMKGHIDIIKTLIATKPAANLDARIDMIPPAKTDFRKKNTYKQLTPLMLAVQRIDDEIALLLIESKANIHAKTLAGETVLVRALMNPSCSPELVRALITAGADIDDLTVQKLSIRHNEDIRKLLVPASTSTPKQRRRTMKETLAAIDAAAAHVASVQSSSSSKPSSRKNSARKNESPPSSASSSSTTSSTRTTTTTTKKSTETKKIDYSDMRKKLSVKTLESQGYSVDYVLGAFENKPSAMLAISLQSKQLLCGRAAELGHVDIVRHCLKHYPSLFNSMFDYHGKNESMLGLAVLHNRYEIVEMLLQAIAAQLGGDVDDDDDDDEKKSLHSSTTTTKTATENMLTMSLVNLEVLELNGSIFRLHGSKNELKTPLMRAVIQDNGPIVELLLDAGASVDPVIDNGECSSTSAIGLVRSIEVLRALLRPHEQGQAKPRVFVDDKSTAMMLCVETDDVNLARQILQLEEVKYDKYRKILMPLSSNTSSSDDDPDIQEHKTQEPSNTSAYDAFIVACRNGCSELVSLLIDVPYIAHKINERDNDSGLTPFQLACSCGSIDIMKTLFRINPNIVEEKVYNLDATKSPLILATLGNHYEAVKWLLQHKSEISWNDKLSQGKMERGRWTYSEPTWGNKPLPKPAKTHDVTPRGQTLTSVSELDSARSTARGSARFPNGERSGLMFAAHVGNVDMIRLYMKRKDLKDIINAQDSMGWTSLMIAARSGFADCMNVLLDNGADINLTDQEGNNALFIGILTQQNESVELLANHKTLDRKHRNRKGRTAIALAVRVNRTDYVKKLAAIDGFDINKSDAFGDCPTHHSVGTNNIDMIRILLELGCDALKLNDRDYALIHVIALNKTRHALPMLKTLLKYDSNDSLNVVTKKNRTALMLACNSGQYVIVEELLKRKARIDIIDVSNETALTLALRRQSMDLIRIILKQPNIEEELKRTTTLAVPVIMWNDNPEIVKLLIENGYPVNHTDKRGRTPLLLDARSLKGTTNSSDPSLIGIKNRFIALLDGGADPNVRSRVGETPLGFLLAGDLTQKMQVDGKFGGPYYDALNAIMSHQPDCNVLVCATLPPTWPVLWNCLFCGFEEGVELCMKNGADLSLAGKDGQRLPITELLVFSLKDPSQKSKFASFNLLFRHDPELSVTDVTDASVQADCVEVLVHAANMGFSDLCKWLLKHCCPSDPESPLYTSLPLNAKAQLAKVDDVAVIAILKEAGFR